MDTSVTLEQGALSEKEQQWKKVEKEVENIEKKDPHGLKIDPKIKRTVIGLNALGFDTTMSCEGHLDHGRGSPYIEISARETASMRSMADVAYIMQRRVDYERLREHVKKINTKLLLALQEYLAEFYTNLDVQESTRLIAELTPYGKIVLKNQGETIQQDAKPDERLANLTAFQTEMESFGIFLEEKFFNV